MAGAEAAPPSACRKALDFYWGNYLPLMMVFVVFFGYFVPAPGATAAAGRASCSCGWPLTRLRVRATGKALDKPKIELCGETDADCEMGSMKVQQRERERERERERVSHCDIVRRAG